MVEGSGETETQRKKCLGGRQSPFRSYKDGACSREENREKATLSFQRESCDSSPKGKVSVKTSRKQSLVFGAEQLMEKRGRARGCRPVIPATQEAGVGEPQTQDQLG